MERMTKEDLSNFVCDATQTAERREDVYGPFDSLEDMELSKIKLMVL